MLILAGFSNVDGDTDKHGILLSRYPSQLGTGKFIYEGVSPVVGILPYRNRDGSGWFTAFTNVEGERGRHRVHWDKQAPFGTGRVVYDDRRPITSMIWLRDSVGQALLTAFANAEGEPEKYQIQASKASEIGRGQVLYEGVSPVLSICQYRGGYLTAFGNVGGEKGRYRVHFDERAPFGSGPVVYDGHDPITMQMVPNPRDYDVLTGFSYSNEGQTRYRIHRSRDINILQSTDVLYDDVIPVLSLARCGSGYLTVVEDTGSDESLFRASYDHETRLGKGDIVYRGVSPITALACVDSRFNDVSNANDEGEKVEEEPESYTIVNAYFTGVALVACGLAPSVVTCVPALWATYQYLSSQASSLGGQ